MNSTKRKMQTNTYPRGSRLSVLAATLFLISAATAPAALVTWTFETEVKFLGSSGGVGVLDTVGDPAILTFTFDDSVLPPDTNASPDRGQYAFTDGVNGVSLSFSDGNSSNSLVAGDNFTVEIESDDDPDEISIRNASFVGVGVVSIITIRFPDGTFSDDALFTSARMDGFLDDVPFSSGGSVSVIGTFDVGAGLEDGTFTVSVSGSGDTTPPVISGVPKRVIVNTPPSGADAIVEWEPITANDDVDGAVPVTCTPVESGGTLGIGVHTITCSAEDSSGNMAMETFEVIVVPTSEAGVGAPLEAVLLRGDPAGNSEHFLFQEMAINNHPQGAHVVVRSLNGSIGVWNAFGFLATQPSFGDLTVDDDTNWAASVQSNTSHRLLASTTRTAVVGNAAPGGGTFKGLHKPSIARGPRNTHPYYGTAARLDLADASTTVLSDTGIWTTDPNLVANSLVSRVREGDVLPASVGIASSFGQVAPRLVMCEAPAIAFSSFINIAPGVGGGDNSAVFAGDPDGGIVVVVREGDLVPGAEPNVFSAFEGESINVAGELAFRASVRHPPGGTPVGVGENQGLWTNLGGTMNLVVREGDSAPGGGEFGRIAEFYVTDDQVVFRAYLKGAGINSANDGSLWRWSAQGGLCLIVREGGVAPGTSAGVIRTIHAFGVAESGLVATTVRLVPGVGDAVTTRDQGLLVSDPALGVVRMRVREGDIYEVQGIERRVTGLKLSNSGANPSGGTGGYARVINRGGDVGVIATFDQQGGGAFYLRTDVASCTQ